MLLQQIPTSAISDFANSVYKRDDPVAIACSPKKDDGWTNVKPPRGYHRAVVKVHTSSFQIAVAREYTCLIFYKSEIGPFNVAPMEVPDYIWTVYDAIWGLRNLPTSPMYPTSSTNTGDQFYDLTAEDWHDSEYIYPDEGLNEAAKYRLYWLTKKRRDEWQESDCEKVFSMHCPKRLAWTKPSPVIHSSSSRYLHPKLHRPLTIKELAMIMGWQDQFPTGLRPVTTIATTVPPPIACWLRYQAEAFMAAETEDDYESTFDSKNNVWNGQNTPGWPLKTFDLRQFRSYRTDISRFPKAVFQEFPPPVTQQDLPWNPWKETVPHDSD